MTNVTKYPFLYFIPKSWTEKWTERFGPSNNYRKIRSVEKDTWIVKIATHIDYTEYQSIWMDDPKLGDIVLVPDVDLAEEQSYEFHSEAEAISFIANWWKSYADSIVKVEPHHESWCTIYGNEYDSPESFGKCNCSLAKV